jgi:hypothetical protein
VGVAQGLAALQFALWPGLGAGAIAATPEVPRDGGKWRLLFRLGSLTACGAGSPSAPSESWLKPLLLQNRIRGSAARR